jgi:hypothetical protein
MPSKIDEADWLASQPQFVAERIVFFALPRPFCNCGKAGELIHFPGQAHGLSLLRCRCGRLRLVSGVALAQGLAHLGLHRCLVHRAGSGHVR